MNSTNQSSDFYTVGISTWGSNIKWKFPLTSQELFSKSDSVDD